MLNGGKDDVFLVYEMLLSEMTEPQILRYIWSLEIENNTLIDHLGIFIIIHEGTILFRAHFDQKIERTTQIYKIEEL